MKEVLLFVKWQWQRWEFWQKCYIIGAFFFGMGVAMPKPYNVYVMAVPVAMFFTATFKWWVWDQLKDSWNKYKKEKAELFEVIKGDR